ncbi:hypothetical protein HDZ31DRAFT_47344 [Schizophyllum fasciatum]
MFSREDFELACKAYVSSRPAGRNDGQWTWNDYSSPYTCAVGYGYLARTTSVFASDDTLQGPAYPTVEDMKAIESSLLDVTDDESLEIDDAAAPLSTTKVPLSCHQYVVYAPGFQVPAFYFTIHNSQGSPLRVDDLVRTSLFRPSAFSATARSSFAITPSASSFPLLSQGDHPVLGTPCWYLHPCETATALAEIMSEMAYDDGGSRDRRLQRTLEAWFMLLNSIVSL